METAPRTMSKVLGQHGCNRKALAEQGVLLRVRENVAVAAGTILAEQQVYEIFSERNQR